MPTCEPIPGIRRAWPAAVAGVLLTACAAAPLDSRHLEETRARYAAAEQTPEIFDHAASSMHPAREHLLAAERLFEASAAQDEVDHHSFVSRQHVAIAEARLQRGLAQLEIERSEQRLHALMLEARKRRSPNGCTSKTTDARTRRIEAPEATDEMWRVTE